ncbi:MAG: alpha/beta hydrolase family protein [Promethearchaeota archaeon]
MFQNFFFEIHPFQFSQLKRNAEKVNSLILQSSKEILLHGLEAIPKQSGEKYPVAILFHGYSSNYRRIAYIANMLLTNGVAVILMNLRGHGKSSGKQKDINGMQQDIETIMKYVKSKLEYDEGRILMLGISLGALITLTTGYNHPEITHLIALAAISSPTDLFDGMTAFKRWRWRIIGKFGGINIPSMIGKPPFTPKLQPQSGNKSKRLLLLHCKYDTLVAENNFWTNVAAFKLEPENYEIFPKGGHSFFLIKHQVLSSINVWLRNNDFYRAE